MNDTARNLRYERVATFALWMSGFSPVALLSDSRSRAADIAVGFTRLFNIFQIHAPRQRGPAQPPRRRAVSEKFSSSPSWAAPDLRHSEIDPTAHWRLIG